MDVQCVTLFDRVISKEIGLWFVPSKKSSQQHTVRMVASLFLSLLGGLLLGSRLFLGCSLLLGGSLLLRSRLGLLGGSLGLGCGLLL